MPIFIIPDSERIKKLERNMVTEKYWEEVQNRLSDINPDEIINKFAMIAVAGSDTFEGAENIIIPPLKIINWAYEKINYATLETINPMICFLGKPLEPVRKLNEVNSPRDYSSLTGVQFHSYDRYLQPHYCLNEEFRSYLDSQGKLIPIRISGTWLETHFTKEFISDGNNFTYIGDGDFKLFIPGTGFNGKWPEEYRHLAILQKMEDDFISTYGKSI